jgi:uncharacterized protein (UPF0305 family)
MPRIEKWANLPPAVRQHLIDRMRAILPSLDVRDVMASGKPVVRDAKILTPDEKAILAKAEEYRAKVSASLQ